MLLFITLANGTMKPIRVRADLGLLVLRLATGIVFLMHGYQKVFTYGFAGVGDAFTKMGVPAGPMMGPAIGLLELLGGIALIIWVGTRIGGLARGRDMLGAVALG